ncbi:syntaxin-11a [Syngnathus typhle]|uniref:syntaxin-11a n=1 Tax=Syngnathus typhle TaxID=161592 RepID=UPI002A6A3DFC|nr:syntaxin-11a [Syngnathus typhle]XP_061156480.1 syntaxin-11a [Syngnathus typhle]
MIDRLSKLRAIASKPPEVAEYNLEVNEGDPEQNEWGVPLFSGQEAMEGIHREVQVIRKEILLLNMDVKRLGKESSRFLTSVRRFSSIKRDANALGRAIKTRGEALMARLETLGRMSEELARVHGDSSVVARVARCQHAALTGNFHQAMTEYNRAEMEQRANCTARIQRQAAIVGKEVTRCQIEEMMETGKWDMFVGDGLLMTADVRGARSALSEIESRRRQLMELEGRIRDVRDLFFQVALMVEEQGCKADQIEAHVCGARDYVVAAGKHVRQAVKYKKANPCKKIFCCCFPCCH